MKNRLALVLCLACLMGAVYLPQTNLTDVIADKITKASNPQVTTLVFNFKSTMWRTKGVKAFIVVRICEDPIHLANVVYKDIGLIWPGLRGLTYHPNHDVYFVWLQKSDNAENVLYHELTHVAQLVAIDNKYNSLDLEPEAYIIGELFDQLVPIIMKEL